LGSAPYASSANYALNAGKLNGLTAAEIISQTLAAVPDATPAGVIDAFGGATAPEGYLICDGRAVSRAQYPALFAAIGTFWGAGDGSTTFNLPDLQGRFLRGPDGGTGRDEDAASRVACNAGGNTGAAVGSCEGDIMQAHKHTESNGGHQHYYGTWKDEEEIPSGSGTDTAVNDHTDRRLTEAASVVLGDPVESMGGAVRYGMETRPENVTVLFIIKY